jgi:hypothetical protein
MGKINMKRHTFECDKNGRSYLSNKKKKIRLGGMCPELIKCSTGKLREMLRRSCERCINGEQP